MYQFKPYTHKSSQSHNIVSNFLKFVFSSKKFWFMTNIEDTLLFLIHLYIWNIY